MENLKWHQKPSGVIILLILFWPVGLYLMWKNGMWSKNTRYAISAVCVILTLGASQGEGNGSTTSVGASSGKPNVCDCMQAYINNWKDGRGRTMTDLRGNCYEHYSEPFTDHDEDCPPAQIW